MRIYYDQFSSLKDMCEEFHIEPSSIEDVTVLYAIYDTPAYEGWAFVVFAKDGKLYEVTGSHCSCYGLEDQWEPTLTSVDALLMRENISEECKLVMTAYSRGLLGFL